jgi:PTH1 family peptidyl-tRNA hydrolase
MKVIVGLGNPGSEYDGTRHNVGWWVLDRLAYDWGFEAYERERLALVSEGTVAEEPVRLVKPTTFMNRSGAALVSLRLLEGFALETDLLVVVDDAAIEIGRVRFRPSGGAGGHNGLKSVTASVGTDAYARMRVGVGVAPPGLDLAEWVLSEMPPEDEEVVVGLLPELTKGVEVWMAEGVEEAMDRFNR